MITNLCIIRYPGYSLFEMNLFLETSEYYRIANCNFNILTYLILQSNFLKNSKNPKNIFFQSNFLRYKNTFMI